MLLNREPSAVETYNDIDGEVVNFFRVLRGRKEKLVESYRTYSFFARGILLFGFGRRRTAAGS